MTDYDLLTLELELTPELEEGQFISTPLLLKDGGSFWHGPTPFVARVVQHEDRTEVDLWCALDRLVHGIFWQLVPDTRGLLARVLRKKPVMAYVPFQATTRGPVVAMLQELVNFLQKEENVDNS